jgi:endo-1,4-beta-D-glucanase Y
LSVLLPQSARAIGQQRFVEYAESTGGFRIAGAGSAAAIYVDPDDFPGVIRAAGDLQADIARVTGTTPAVVHDPARLGAGGIVVGTVGKCRVIDGMIRDGRLTPAPIVGKWEASMTAVVPGPLAGSGGFLVIAGSDKRGAIYGVYDVSEQMGVSPWYWWADVPVVRRDALWVRPGSFVRGPPAVKYRGIFLNDEAPDLTNWIREKFGTVPPGRDPPIPAGVANYGHEFYARMFELILRLRGNYLWPAMWNNAFNEDDPENPRLADEYGVVMGTSHQEPMLRAQKEWDRRYEATLGSWNYARQPRVIEEFWRAGIRRNKAYESIITVGLRGANDTPMAPGGPAANRELLEKIVGVQRKILRDELNPDVTRVPQLWCLYKEVQEFYDAGMRVPDDVTLLWCDDNWGNLRRLPTAIEREREGGAGIYYHFDYHGGPRSYQWINTNPISKIWDQLSLAHQYGADRIWIVNVGHFKGYEFPLEYFMDLAWDPDRWTGDNVGEYTREWAAREFGPSFASEIAEIVSLCTKYNGRCKPELLAPDTFSLVDYREAETVLSDFDDITAKAEDLYRRLPAGARDAFYELVLFPTKAGAWVNRLYLAAGRNALYARQKRATTNDEAARVRELFQGYQALMENFNRTLAGGKWDHFMDQPVLGYTSWRDPRQNNLDAIKLVEMPIPDAAAMGVALEGSMAAWPGGIGDPVLPRFDVFSQQRRYVDIFNKGRESFEFSATASDSWIVLSAAKGTVAKDARLWVSIDWSKVPQGSTHGTVKVSGANVDVTIGVDAFRPTEVTRDSLEGFVESEGVVSIESEHYSAKTDAGAKGWTRIEDYGNTLSGMRATAPVDDPGVATAKDAPRLEYRMYLFSAGKVDVTAILGPTLNFMPGRGLRLGFSFDDGSPQVVSVVPQNAVDQNGNPAWEKCVRNNAHQVRSRHVLAEPGYHTLKVWMVDPGVVVEKLVVDLGGLKPSYLGPPESYRRVAAPVRGAFATRHYPDLFKELLGRTDAEIDAKVQAGWNQLFYGREDTERIYFPVGADQAYIADIAHNDVRTEGMSYGMMIAVQLNRKVEFDRIWSWARAHMYHADGPFAGYFAWHCALDGRQLDPGPACDGEEWFATALLFAENRWGNGGGIFNYGAEAQALLRTMLHKRDGEVGPMFNRAARQVLFVPRGDGSTFTDPSYHLPAFYELWARWAEDHDDRIFWREAAAESRIFFRKAANDRTGLMPDYARFDGTPRQGGGHEDFRYDAWRTFANVALDHAWFAEDPWQVMQSNRVLGFLGSQGLRCPNQFALDGRPLSTDSSPGLGAMAAVAGLAASPDQARPFVEALWKAGIPAGRYRYYDGLLYLLSVLEVSGRFRIYGPVGP